MSTDGHSAMAPTVLTRVNKHSQATAPFCKTMRNITQMVWKIKTDLLNKAPATVLPIRKLEK